MKRAVFILNIIYYLPLTYDADAVRDAKDYIRTKTVTTTTTKPPRQQIQIMYMFMKECAMK